MTVGLCGVAASKILTVPRPCGPDGIRLWRYHVVASTIVSGTMMSVASSGSRIARADEAQLSRARANVGLSKQDGVPLARIGFVRSNPRDS